MYEAGPDAVVDLVQGLIQKFTAIVEQQAAQIQTLNERVKTLENQINLNSRNSGKPPSSDGYRKPQPKSLRENGKRPSGGQPGHQGHTLEFTANPDHIIIHKVSQCPCGHHVDGDPVLNHETRQVYDLPEIRLESTEHRIEIRKCSACGNTVKGTFPADVTAPVQYGPRFRAAATYLNQYQLLPYERVSQVLEDLFGHHISEGTLFNINQLLFDQLEPAEKAIGDAIASSAVVHFDETGVRVTGKTKWTHVACTDRFTHYTVHDKRGSEGMEAAGILPSFQGTAVHDSLAAYFSYSCLHALCNAHSLRELIFVLEQENQQWAKLMINLLLEAKLAVETHGQLSADTINSFVKRYDVIVNLGLAEDAKLNPIVAKVAGKRGRQKQSKPKNLLDRLLLRRLEFLAFLCDPQIPFDNNQAERDLRMIKVQQKVSGSFRSLQGAKIFCRIRGYISTARKNAQPAIQVIADALSGTPYIPV